MAGALTGLKILDFSALLPGPFATMTLSDMGADVLRVASRTRPDLLDIGFEPRLPGKRFSAVAAQVGRNKRVLTLNLKAPEAKDIIFKLVDKYDILLEQYRPGTMEKLGLDYETLRKINPRLIYCSLTGYGQNNSYALRAGHDINYIALSGIGGYSGRQEGGPVLNGIPLADIASGSCNAMIGILAAVIYRERTGKGQYVDISMLDGAVALNVMAGAGTLLNGESPAREGLLVNGSTLYDYYETKDGEYLSVGSMEPKFWQNLCKAVGKDAWMDKGIDAGSEAKEDLAAIIRSKTRAEWEVVFGGTEACVEPVLSLAEALDSAVVKERGMVVSVPDSDGGTLRQVGCPFKFSESPARYDHAGKPVEEADTINILRETGYSEAEIAAFDAAGVLK